MTSPSLSNPIVGLFPGDTLGNVRDALSLVSYLHTVLADGHEVAERPDGQGQPIPMKAATHRGLVLFVDYIADAVRYELEGRRGEPSSSSGAAGP